MQLASRATATVLPEKSPAIENIQAAWKFAPCDQIGGDIFNIHNIDERNVGVYMLDVCGHGVPAALISVAASQFLNSGDGLLGNNCELQSPEIVLNRLDQAFPFERFDSFFSIICMSLDVKQGRLSYSCAGHPTPLIMRSNAAMEVLDRRGPVIGFGNNLSYDQETIQLCKGDRLFLYTDGLVECRNPAGDSFGKQRFLNTLREFQREPLQAMVDAVYGRVQQFCRQSSPDDDISLLAVEYGGR